MNVPTKILKNNISTPSPLYTFNQNLLKKYHKISKNLKSPNNSKKNDGDVSGHVPPKETNTLQEEALKWFFNLDLAKRIKICLIQNKIIVNILYQMYVHSFLDPKVKFQIRSNVFSDEVEEIYPIIYTNNSNATSILNVNVNSINKNGENHSNAHYLNYFQTNSCVQTNINMSNFIKMNDQMEKEFLKEIKIFKCEEQNDSLILSINLLTNETVFKKYFSYFTNNKYFNNYITPTHDQSTKQYNLLFGDWINNKDHYTFSQLVVGYFEQVIMTWFYFHKNMDEKSFNILLLSLPYDKKIANLLEDMDKVVSFLKKELKSNLDRKKMLEDINLKNISLILRKDKQISDAVGLRKKTWDNVSHFCYNNMYFHHFIDKKNLSDVLEDAENFVRDNFYKLNEEHFVENLQFINLDKIFSYEDFFYKKVWDEIHNLYTRQNALDLINENENIAVSILNPRKMSYNTPYHNFIPVPEINKKKKNLKKNKKVKRYEKEENSPLSSSTEKTLKNNLATSAKETANSLNTINIKPKKEDNFIEEKKHDSNIQEFIKSFVNSLISKAIDNVCIINFNQKKNSNEIYGNDTDTAYSSSNKSDGTSIITKTKKSYKRKKDNFFLYPVNPSQIKNKNYMKKNIDLTERKLSVSNTLSNHKSISQCSSPRENLISISNNILNKEKCNSQIISKLKIESAQKLEKLSEQKNKKEEIKAKSEEPIKIENSTNKNITEKEKINSISNLEKVNNHNTENKNINITINTPVYNNFYIINSPNSIQLNPNINQIKSNLTESNLSNYISNPNYMTNNNFRNNIQINNTNPLNFAATSIPINLQNDEMNNINNFSINNQIFGSSNHHFNPLHTFDSYNKFMQYGNLHNDIVSYSREVFENIIALKGIKMAIIKKIEEFIKESLNDYNVSLSLYGSFATDLEIESSDIDITVKYQNKNEHDYRTSQSYLSQNYTIESIISRLVKSFTTKNVFHLINPIYTATVPVIKLQLDINSLLNENEKKILENFRDRENYKNFKFSREELDIVKIDLTFMENIKNNTNMYESPSQQAVEYVKNSLLCFPEIRPLLHVLKRFLQLEKLNSSFNGGLSSFSLFLIVLAFLKMRKFNNMNFGFNNLGNILLEFLDFYSNFNFNYTFIDINSANPFIVSNEILEQVPLILDPITYLNPAKSSYRIEEVKQFFIKTSNFIYRTLFNFNFSGEKNINIIYSIFESQQKIVKTII